MTDRIPADIYRQCTAVAKSHYTMLRRRNLLEAADDALVTAGVLADDNSKIVVSHDGSRVLLDRDTPRTEIYITEAQNEL